MNFEEFLNDDNTVDAPNSSSGRARCPQRAAVVGGVAPNVPSPDSDIPAEIDVQKAVVESLAAEKVEQDEKISKLERENESLKSEVSKLNAEISALREKLSADTEKESLKKEVESLRKKCEEQSKELVQMGDALSKNSEGELSSKIALIERDTDVPDRFTGETREHVLEVIAEAQKKADADGRIRRAQVLEGVLIANESSGELAERRASLEKLFNDNSNVINGTVIEELVKMGISHKNGEEYLLPSEIITRNY